MTAYEDAIRGDEHEVGALVRRPRRQQVVHAPRRGRRIVRALEKLDLRYPKLDKAKRKELEEVRKALK